jgi:uncharacterized repeat protein (TIGR03843 family)
VELTSGEVLALLREGEIDVMGRMPWASNATFLVEVTADGVSMPAVYKPARGERPLWDFPEGTLANREVAAYVVSEALGWSLVPPTVLRDGPHGLGSVQRFVHHDPERHYFALLEEGGHDDVLRRFAAFDVVVNNTDRKAGHVVADPDNDIWGFDHGVCFHAQWKLRTVIWDFGGERLPADVLADLERLVEGVNGSTGRDLRGLLAAHEVEAVCARTADLLARGRLPTVEPGYHGYPWPLV